MKTRMTKVMINKKTDEHEFDMVHSATKYMFGLEQINIFRRFLIRLKMFFKPESVVKDNGLWLLFRKNEDKAMEIVKNIADTIELEFDRNNGVEFLNAYRTICETCTPNTIHRILQLMFRHPVYFQKNIPSDSIKRIAEIPTIDDDAFSISLKPIKVEYVGNFSTMASILTEKGPYITAKFETITKEDSDVTTTVGEFEFFMGEGVVLEQGFPVIGSGTFKYTVTVSVKYLETTTLTAAVITDIIRSIVCDTVSEQTFWIGYIGEDRPKSRKRNKAYYRLVLGFIHNISIESMSEMVKKSKMKKSVALSEYSVQTYYESSEGQINLYDGEGQASNFNISGDAIFGLPVDNSFTVTIYPPLETRAKRKPIVLKQPNNTVEITQIFPHSSDLVDKDDRADNQPKKDLPSGK